MLDNTSSSSRAFVLEPSFDRVLNSCSGLREVFLMARNERCIVGSLAAPLRYARIGRRDVAWSDSVSLNLSRREKPVVLAYNEESASGAMEGVEFFDRRGNGRLKAFRTSEVPTAQWQKTWRSMVRGQVAPEALAPLRKTNHLDSVCCVHCRPLMQPGGETKSEDEQALKALVRDFWSDAIEHGKLIDATAPCGILRARLSFVPVGLEWKREWLFALSGTAGCHLHLAGGCAGRLVERAGGVRTLDLLTCGGDFITRLCSRPNL